MAVALVSILAMGGHYWRRQDGSPGHSLAVPSQTRFKIKVSGRNEYRERVVLDGYLVIGDGKYVSANEAVGATRPHVKAHDAFLYVEFFVDGKWRDADAMRRSDDFQVEAAEECALDEAIRHLKSKLKDWKQFDQAQRFMKAARVVERNPQLLERGRVIAMSKQPPYLDV